MTVIVSVVNLTSLGWVISRSIGLSLAVVNDFLQQLKNSHVNWPARSLDLNPPEHFLDVLGDERE